jgi:hypothetical protein
VHDLEAVRRRIATKKDFIVCQECDKPVPLMDFIEQRLKSDPVARKILAMDKTTTLALDTQALEQILIGHMMASCGEANQVFRLLPLSQYGIDGEVEFKDNDGKLGGKKIFVQLKSWENKRDLHYWSSLTADVYIVLREADETGSGHTIRWMNATRQLQSRKPIKFEGEKLDAPAIWRARDAFFPPPKRS